MIKLASKIKHRFTVFPQDANNVGTLFGGKLMSEMDMAAAMLCRKLIRSSEAEEAVTASFAKIDFLAPSHINDLIEITAELKMIGKSSLLILLRATKEDPDGNQIKIGSSSATFVSLKDKKSFPHGLRWDQIENKYFE